LAQKWKYDCSSTPPTPVFKDELCGEDAELLVDTSFSGEVPIPFQLFERLGLLSYLTPNEYHAVLPHARKIRLYTATGTLLLGSEEHTVEIHSIAPY
jgi:predicted aspartyl protease